MEKEADILKYETKIVLPSYKIAYAVCFMIILSLIRSVVYSNEVGIAMEAPMAIFAAIFCADTYTKEIASKRSEIQRLYPMKKRVFSIYKRLMIQGIFLLALSVIGYGLFFAFQSPSMMDMKSGALEAEINMFFHFLLAIMVTISFWGLLSNLFACLFRNMWMAIGGCLILWVITNSSAADRYLGAWNLFSYTFRDIENSNDFNWIYGKIVCLVIEIIIMAILPKVIKKRG